MKQTATFLSILAAMSVCVPAPAQTPDAEFAAAVTNLCCVPNYTWTTTREMPGAPFKVPPVTGITDASGFVMLRSETGKRMAVAKGDARAVRTSSGWKAAAELEGTKDPQEQALLSARTPADDLNALAGKLSAIKSADDGLLSGELDAAAAKDYLASALAGRQGPGGATPEIKSATGEIKLWCKEGLPRKYTITINAEISLPFGRKKVSQVTTTEVRDIGETTVNVPAEARKALGE